ncbi:MAG: hypothetical protein V1698_01050, partial [bacterium]
NNAPKNQLTRYSRGPVPFTDLTSKGGKKMEKSVKKILVLADNLGWSNFYGLSCWQQRPVLQAVFNSLNRAGAGLKWNDKKMRGEAGNINLPFSDTLADNLSGKIAFLVTGENEMAVYENCGCITRIKNGFPIFLFPDVNDLREDKGWEFQSLETCKKHSCISAGDVYQLKMEAQNISSFVSGGIIAGQKELESIFGMIHKKSISKNSSQKRAGRFSNRADVLQDSNVIIQKTWEFLANNQRLVITSLRKNENNISWGVAGGYAMMGEEIKVLIPSLVKSILKNYRQKNQENKNE